MLYQFSSQTLHDADDVRQNFIQVETIIYIAKLYESFQVQVIFLCV